MTSGPGKVREIPWLRIAAEGAVVVASILLALAIDTWWAERQERKLEREELSRLYAEFEINRDRLLAKGNVQERAAAASLEVYERMGQAMAGGAEAVAVPETVLAVLVAAPTFEAQAPVFDGLVRSGRIEIIEDRRIVDTLAEWERLSRNTSEFELRARRYVDDMLLPALIGRGNIAHVLLNQYSQTRIVALDPDGSRALRVDVEIMSLVAQRYHLASMAVDSREQMHDAASEVMKAISAYLER